jgi:hypothetical protein
VTAISVMQQMTHKSGEGPTHSQTALYEDIGKAKESQGTFTSGVMHFSQVSHTPTHKHTHMQTHTHTHTQTRRLHIILSRSIKSKNGLL